MLKGTFDKFRGDFLEILAPGRCHWCGGATRTAPVCRPCAGALPWNRTACRACGLPLATGSHACAECLRRAPPQDRTWTAFTYREPVAEQIVSLKFHGRLAPAHVLGALMADALAARPDPLPELLIPVPLHDARLRRRGYNQALELGREISRRLSIPLLPQAARRLRATGEQSRLDAVARRRNVRAAFQVDPAVRGRHVALLDDVITTGATIAELSRAARAAGAARVEAWAAARVP